MKIPNSLKKFLNFQSSEKVNININGKYYNVNKMFAICLSSSFYHILNNNPTIHTISIDIDDKKELFKKFIQGEDIEENFFLKLSMKLNNSELIKEWKRNKGQIRKENIKERLNKMIEIGMGIEYLGEEIEFIGEHFEDIKNEIDIDNIPSKYLIEIIKNIKRIENEEEIWTFIKRRIEKEGEEEYRKKLIESIKIEGLKDETIYEIIKMMKYNEITEGIWNKIKDLIEKVKDIDLSKKIKKFNKIKINFKKNEKGKGIFNWLTENNGGNIVDKQIIKLTSSSDPDSRLKYITEWKNTGRYFQWNDNQSDAWILFEFGTRLIKIDGYTIRRIDYRDCVDSIYNWRIEGFSVENNEWIEIDRQCNNWDVAHQLNFGFSKELPLSPKFNSIRLKPGATRINHYDSEFNHIEFYGVLYEPK